MRLIVMFDLPIETKDQQKKYTAFRKFLINDGFVMLQYSIYSRYCHNPSDCEKHLLRVRKNNPKIGNVRILKVTEKQYENMIILYGEMSEQELTISNNSLVVIK